MIERLRPNYLTCPNAKELVYDGEDERTCLRSMRFRCIPEAFRAPVGEQLSHTDASCEWKKHCRWLKLALVQF